MKLDPKALEAALAAFNERHHILAPSSKANLEAAIQAYCQAAGVVMVKSGEFVPASVAHNAVGYVGLANYAEREREAYRMIDDARVRIAAALEGK